MYGTKKVWESLINLGVRLGMQKELQSKVALSNQLGFLVILSYVLTTPILLITHQNGIVALNILAIACTITVFVLNKAGNILASRLLLCLIPPFYLLLVGTALIGYEFRDIYFVVPLLLINAAMAIPMVLFTWKERKVLFGVLTFQLLLQLLFFPIQIALGGIKSNPEVVFSGFVLAINLVLIGVFVVWVILYSLLQQETQKSMRERNILIDELKTSNRLLSIRNKDLQRFSYVVSHDLKTPVRGIFSLTTFLEQDIQEDFKVIPAKVQSYLTMLKDSAHTMQTLIDGILRYSRAGSNKDIGITELAPLLESIASTICLSRKFEMTVAPNLPAIMMNPIELYQIFQNLIDNAVKHCDHELPKVDISYRVTGSIHEIIVKDNARGIAGKYHEKVFNMFETLGVPKGRNSSGMGLPLIRKIMENLKGEVYLESEPGEGSAFHLLFPESAISNGQHLRIA